jgi:drug/metabolite transporter (DMT)-like permease
VEGTRPRLALNSGVGLLLVLATAGISGISTFVNGYAVAGTNSDAFVTVRNVVVALLLVPAVLLTVRGADLRLRSQDWGRLLIIGLIGGAIPFLLFFRGLQLATADGGATSASFLYRTLFLWATTFAILYLGERFRLRIAVAAALLLAGNLLLLALTSTVWTDGTIYVMAATLLWAGEYTLSKRTLRDLPTGVVALGRMGFGAIFLMGYLALTGGLLGASRFSPAQWEWVAISAVLLAGFVATWYAGLRRLDLSTASAVLVLGYPVTVILSVLVKGTPTPWTAAVGAVLVAAGVLVASGPALLREAARALEGRAPAPLLPPE